VLPKTDVAPVAGQIWLQHKRRRPARSQEPPGAPTQRSCRRRQQPSHDSARDEGPKLLGGFDPAPPDSRSDPTSRQPSSVSAAAYAGRWRRCPEGSAPPQRRRPSLRATSRRGCWPRSSRWQAPGQRCRSQAAAWILACHDRPDWGRHGPLTPGTHAHGVHAGPGPVDRPHRLGASAVGKIGAVVAIGGRGRSGGGRRPTGRGAPMG
jgi:hypothetical protein